MIAPDTNILVYAHREDSPHHLPALGALRGLAEGAVPFAVPWPCVSEFLAVVTHPRIYQPPSSAAQALSAIRGLAELPQLRLIGESQDHLAIVDSVVRPGLAGAKMHDARIAAICLGHGISTLWTADRDFSYFPDLRTHNPLV